MKTMAVMGAGQMGSGIAHVCAPAGLSVHLGDVDPAALERAVQTIDRNLVRQVSRGKISEGDKQAAMAHIATGTDYGQFGDCDILIEAATEKQAVKPEAVIVLVAHLPGDATDAATTPTTRGQRRHPID